MKNLMIFTRVLSATELVDLAGEMCGDNSVAVSCNTGKWAAKFRILQIKPPMNKFMN